MRRFIRRVKRIIDWLPVLWRMYDWDYSGLYAVLAKQLERMKTAILSGVASDREKTAGQIGFALTIIKRLQEDRYYEKLAKDHEAKWGEGKLVFKEHKSGHMILDDVKHENAKNGLENDMANAEIYKISVRADKMKKQERRLVFNYIAEHIQGWWD